MKIKNLLLLLLLSFFSCKNKTETKRKPPELPKINTKEKIIDKNTLKQKENQHYTSIKPLMPSEDVTCEGACNQLAYCNNKVFNKPSNPKKINICSKTCKSDTTPTGKAKWKVIFKCLTKYRGDKCKELRTCIKDELKKLQQQFHGKDQQQR